MGQTKIVYAVVINLIEKVSLLTPVLFIITGETNVVANEVVNTDQDLIAVVTVSVDHINKGYKELNFAERVSTDTLTDYEPF